MKKILVVLSLTLMASIANAANGCRVGNVSIPSGGSHVQNTTTRGQCETLSCNNGKLTVSTGPCKLSTAAPTEASKLKSR